MTMYIETASPVPFGAIFSLKIVNFIDTTFINLGEWLSARKTARVLNSLTISQLEDIGVTQAEAKIYF